MKTSPSSTDSESPAPTAGIASEMSNEQLASHLDAITSRLSMDGRSDEYQSVQEVCRRLRLTPDRPGGEELTDVDLAKAETAWNHDMDHMAPIELLAEGIRIGRLTPGDRPKGGGEDEMTKEEMQEMRDFAAGRWPDNIGGYKCCMTGYVAGFAAAMKRRSAPSAPPDASLDPSYVKGYQDGIVHGQTAERLAKQPPDAAAVEALAKADRWILSHWEMFSGDHACAECYPNGDILIKGFQCAVHAAKARHLTALRDSGTTARQGELERGGKEGTT